MPSYRARRGVGHFALMLIGLWLVLAERSPVRGQSGAASDEPPIDVANVAPKYHLISQADANILLFAGEDMSVVVGVQRPALVARTKVLMRTLGAKPVKYAVMAEDETAPAWGDGGWGREGAMTLAHEMLFLRMMQAQARATRAKETTASDGGSGYGGSGGHSHGSGSAVGQGEFTYPLLSFSAVIQVYPKDEEIHVIRERRGYTDADIIVHYEKEGVLYLGNTFTTDGYPSIDISRKGSLGGIIATVEFFLREFSGNLPKVEPIIPGRGPVATLKDLREYRQMLVTIRDRVQAKVQDGWGLDQVLAARLSADLDARWGNGPVSGERFVAMVFKSPN